MPDVKFYLQAPKDDSSLVMLSFQVAPNRRVRASTGQRVPVKSWNKKKQRARGSGQFDGNASLNMLLDKIEGKVNELDRHCRLVEGRATTPEEVKQAVYELTGRGDSMKKEALSFMEFVEAEIDRRSRLPNYSAHRDKQYRVFFKHLKWFAERYYPTSWDNIDENWFNDFQDYSYNVQNHSVNTVVKHIKILKTFLHQAVKAGHTSNRAFTSFSMREEPPVLTYLTPDELEALYRIDLSANHRLARVRDRAIVSGYTAMRFSDVDRLTDAHFVTIPAREGRIDGIRFMMSKTADIVTIPLHPYVKEIVERYGGRLPVISNQKANDYIKEACRIAGIDSPVTLVRNRGGKKVDEVMPKWQAVTTHTFRATAATNLYRAGVPPKTIMKFGGWKTREVFERYIKLADEEHAVIVAQSSYFKVQRG
ncbi:MAG: site-specific integrase [Lewinellaceae bacterium]|nr:site-specific integrase [Lewinellaceae bacterium]